jgi:hypothetical protein
MELMKTFAMGSFCLLCASHQTDLPGHLVQTHYKKQLLSFCRMASPIRFECTFDSCEQVFLSSYRLLGHLASSHGLLGSCLLDLPAAKPAAEERPVPAAPVRAESPVRPVPAPPATSLEPEAEAGRRASKRPFHCPVCQGWFRSEAVLQQHMAKIHFWKRLMALPVERGAAYHCSEPPCTYSSSSRIVAAGHIAVEHKNVFQIAKALFPAFQLPVVAPGAEAGGGRRPLLAPPHPAGLPVARVLPSTRHTITSGTSVEDQPYPKKLRMEQQDKPTIDFTVTIS